MPLYEYQCEACGHRFEVIQKFSDPPIETCQRCGGAVRKLLSSPAIHFTGSGWYITDYAKKDSGTSSTASTSTESKTETKTETKTEGKADTATPPKPATS